MNKKNNFSLSTFLKLPFSLLIKIIRYVKMNTDEDQAPKYIYKKYEKENLDECYNYFKKYLDKSLLIDQIKDIRLLAINKAIQLNKEKEHFLEFGVFDGESINLFSKQINNNNIYGFDSFKGLRDDWTGHNLPSGHFDRKGKIPKLEKNVKPVVGWVQDTLPKFIRDEKISKVCFLHMDLDTYESTKFVLMELKKYLTKNSIILFDQLYNYPGWKEGEFKALTEVFQENEYEYIAFGKFSKQVTIKIN
jgi:hypothetical protein